MTVLALLLTLMVFWGIFRLLFGAGSRTVAGWFPGSDTAVDGGLGSAPGPRGATLAALAAGTALDALRGAPADATGAILVVAIGAACGYRWAATPTGWILGALGSLAALANALGDHCTDSVDDRRVLTLVLIGGGIVGFVVLRLIFSASGFARGDAATPLVLFGIVALATFVSTPFGLSLADLVPTGPPLTAIVLLFALIVTAMACLPEFTISVLGVGLVVATFSVTTTLGGTCEYRLGTILTVLVAFGATWWVSGRLAAR